MKTSPNNTQQFLAIDTSTLDEIANLLRQAGYQVTPTEGEELRVQGKGGPIYIGVTDQPAQVYFLATLRLMAIPPGPLLLLVNFLNREAEIAAFHLAPPQDAAERLSLDYDPDCSTVVARLVMPAAGGVYVPMLHEALRRFELDINEAVMLSRRDGLVALTPPDIDHI
jgi:hypothetical protein